MITTARRPLLVPALALLLGAPGGPAARAGDLGSVTSDLRDARSRLDDDPGEARFRARDALRRLDRPDDGGPDDLRADRLRERARDIERRADRLEDDDARRRLRALARDGADDPFTRGDEDR